MLIPLIAAVLSLQQASYSNDDFGYEVTNTAFTGKGTTGAPNLLSVDTGYGLPDFILSNDAVHPSTSAYGSATFAITWSPPAAGQTPPSSVNVTVGHNFTLSASGKGTSGLTDARGAVIDSIDGSETFINGNVVSEPEEVYTVALAPQADGTATGTLTVPTHTLSCTFDPLNSTPTSSAETIFVTQFDVPSPMARMLKARRVAK